MNPAPSKEFVLVVNRYFTPFAAALVGVAILMGNPSPLERTASLALLLFGILFNAGTAVLVSRRPLWFGTLARLRLAINFLMNIALFYFLGGTWGPLWLLFVLTPLATGLYADRKRTLLMALAVSGSLLLAYWLRGLRSPVGWGQAFTHAAFILFVAIFINDLKTRLAGS